MDLIGISVFYRKYDRRTNDESVRMLCKMDEGRKRVIGIMAAILTSLHMRTADDLFGGPQGSPRTDKLIAASIQWAEIIMAKIDERFWKQ
jgi:hypothetical protein